jgi:8-oxo-dGTP diphosphatase
MAGSGKVFCPACGQDTGVYRNPVPTVDIIIELAAGVVMIQRKNPPYGWAIPGGFVDCGETVEQAAHREAREETGLELEDVKMFHVYSDPKRDPRQHTITTVFAAKGKGKLEAGDDAKGAAVFPLDALPSELAFDHALILADYRAWKNGDKGKGMLKP